MSVALPQEKLCKGCGQTKAASEFHRSTRDGLQSYCKACALEATRRWSQRNPAAALRKQFRADLHRKFGLTQAEYETMVEAQQGVCAICGRPERKISKKGRPFRLAIDHDHVTGEIRALLCQDCNFLIGIAADDSERLRAAAAYLESFVDTGDEAFLN